MTEREREILGLIESDPLISQEALAEKLGIQRSSVGVHISNLMKKGYIKGKGYIVDTAPYIVVVGGSNMDIIGSPLGKLIARDSNIGSVITRPGGVGRNIASNLAALELAVHFISALGQDGFGRTILEDLNAKGIHTTGILTHPNLPTSTYMCINDHTGDMSLAISQMHIVDQLKPPYLKQWHKWLEGARLIVLDANLSEEALAYLLKTYAHKPIYIDPVSTAKSKKLVPLLDKITFIKPNILEAAIMTGLDPQEGEDNQAFGKRLSRALVERGVKEVCISLGSEGVVYANQVENHYFPVIPVELVNTTGAGDAFFAGYCYGAFHNLDFKRRIELALKCAAHQISNHDIELSRVVFEKDNR